MAAQTEERSRPKVLLAIVGVAALLAALALLTQQDDELEASSGERAAAPANRSPTGAGQSIAPADPHDHGESLATAVDAGRVYFPGQGWATVVDPGPNADVPPPLESLPENPNPPEPPPEELPQTARWKLAKTERIHAVMEQRVDRLTREMADARRAGDDAEAQRLEVLLLRTRRRAESLSDDIARLREEAATEPSEEEIVREWEQRTGTPADRIRERDRVDLPPPPAPR